MIDVVLNAIRQRGPITVADFMELALYHPERGYYASAPTRSGRSGDFFTSVDVGPLFGEMVTAQLAEVWALLRARGADRFDLVEAGAGDGRLACDVLDTAARDLPDFYRSLHVTLVERSGLAVAAQQERLAHHTDRVTFAGCSLPRAICGVVLANELLDALPVHRVVVRNGDLREVYVSESGGTLTELEGVPSTPRLEQFLSRTGTVLPEGVFAEVGLASVDWIADAAAALDCGVLLLFDYGFEAVDLYSPRHQFGTLLSYRKHLAGAAHWLASPGENDLTSHVNLTAIAGVAQDAGLSPLGITDQTYFLMSLDIAARLDDGQGIESIHRRLAARTLLMPGGLGSTIKVMAFGKNVGTPALAGFSTCRIT